MNDVCRWFAAVAAIGCAVTGLGVAAPASAAPCPDVEVVFARGTFEPAGVGVVGQAFVDSLTAKAPGKTIDVYAVNYPASLDFATAADGVVDAGNKVRDTAAQCPDTKIVIGGYSQGAAVAGYLTEDTVPAGFTLPTGLTGPMPPSVADHVAAVALFGKPSPGFMQLVFAGAPPIVIGSRYASKTTDQCIADDPVCSPTGHESSAHGQYAADGLVDQAADFTVGKLPRGAASRSVDQAATHG